MSSSRHDQKMSGKSGLVNNKVLISNQFIRYCNYSDLMLSSNPFRPIDYDEGQSKKKKDYDEGSDPTKKQNQDRDIAQK